MQRTNGRQFSKAGAAFKFGPAEGSRFFLRFGWKAARAEVLKTAERLNRAPAELLTFLPIPKGLAGDYPWAGLSAGAFDRNPAIYCRKVEKFFSRPEFDRWPQTRSQIKVFILIDLWKPCIGMWFAHIPDCKYLCCVQKTGVLVSGSRSPNLGWCVDDIACKLKTN
jgi:hypothetical protein